MAENKQTKDSLPLLTGIPRSTLKRRLSRSTDLVPREGNSAAHPAEVSYPNRNDGVTNLVTPPRTTG